MTRTSAPAGSTTPAEQYREHGLLQAKLTPPAETQAAIPRAALAQAICSSHAARLVLVRAPAGFGKTTLMLECLHRFEQMGIATAWVTLDRADNDLSRFLGVMSAALAPLLGTDDDGRAREPSAIGRTALDLLNAVARHAGPFCLFLDDFEYIQEPGVRGFVRELIDAMPRDARLVIGSRSLPELRLGRLRAQNQLLEIDAAQLRFTLDETTAFFARRGGRPLVEEDLARLQRKTEGWVAGLWLAAMALERSGDRAEFIARFSGTERAVAEYLAEEVLASQPEATRGFMLRTSVLRHLEPGICDFVLERADSAQILESLEPVNALLVPIGHGQRSWRYHSLFGGFLREQLARAAPQEVPRLHRRAAQWYISRQRAVPAIDHAVEGGDVKLAASLLESHGGVLLAQGRMRALARWFAALPPDAFERHPLLIAYRVWALCFTRGAREAGELLDRSGIERQPLPALKAHLLALRPLLLAMTDRYEEAYAAGTASLKQLPTDNAFADMVLANAMTTVAAVLGRHEEARRLLDAARRSQGQERSSFNVMYSEGAEGIIDLEQGRLRQATARFRLALNASGDATYNQTHGNSWAGILYATVCYEANDLDQAAHLLHVYLPIARDVQLTDQVISGSVLLSRIAWHRGDIDHAFRTLTELEYLGHQRQLPRLVASAHLERGRLQLLQGHPEAAREELARADDQALWRRFGQLRVIANDIENLTLGRLRLETIAGDAAEAARRLDDEIAKARADSRHRRALKLGLMRAIALQRDNRLPAAVALANEVLRAAGAEGYMRLILDEGRPAAALLRAYLSSAPASADADPIFTDWLDRLQQGFGAAMQSADPPLPAQPTGPADPITRKELRVVQLLAEGYSNNAIAEKLFVSDSTVRTHLRNINAKLGTHSRTQAVAMARRLGLLD